jgi:hypothetical protein
MTKVRRNRITREEDRYILGIGLASGVVAALSSASPTGATWIDAAVTLLFAFLVTWSAASAPWWALLVGAGFAMAGAAEGPLIVLAVAMGAAGAAGWIGSERANQPLVRAGIGAAIVNVAVRLEWNPFFLASAIVALIATGIVVVMGVRRRRKYVRKRIYWGGAVLGVLAVLAVGGTGFAAIQASDTARDGYLGMLDGLEFVQDGNVSDASETLRIAAENLDAAGNDLGGIFTQPARLVPGIAQNRNAGADILQRAADAAASAADTLAVVNLDQLTVSGGVIDVFAFEALEAPLADLSSTINELDAALNDARSPWLVSPFATRLDDAIRRAGQASDQTTATAAAARIAPDMLGANGPRRYFLAFVNTAEARGMNGLMGNWSEVTVDNGRISVTANGRTADLQDDSLLGLGLDASDEYLARYGAYGASVAGGVIPKFWSNVTIPPDMPSVGNSIEQMYEHVTDRDIDGVFVIDPAGIASLLQITGPVVLEEIDRRVDASNAQEFLTLGQYEFAENEREDLLTEVTDATIDNVLNGELPPPQRMAPILAPSVLNGHISGWASNPDEQELFELVGMDAAMPVVTTPGVDAIAVSNNNSSGNKIESFLQRTISYRPVMNESTGEASATLRVELTNNAPQSGFEDYVIGNIIDEPIGTNRMIVDIYTRMGVQAVRLNDQPVATILQPELGYWVTTVQLDVASGDTAVIEMELEGDLGAAPYQLVYRPQALPNLDQLSFEAETTRGDTIFTFDGELERRSVINTLGIDAWR